MQEAADRLTQDAPHDIALGRCSFTGLQLTVTRTGVSRQQRWVDWELCWAKAEIVAKRSDCDPYSTTEESAKASRMPNDGRPWHKCRRSSSIGPWHGMAWHATPRRAVVAASVTVSLVKDIIHYTGMAASNSAGAAETCGHQQLEWWQGLLWLTQAGGGDWADGRIRRRPKLPSWSATSVARAEAASFMRMTVH